MKTIVEYEENGHPEVKEFQECSATYDPEMRELVIIGLECTVIETFPEPELITKVTMIFKDK